MAGDSPKVNSLFYTLSFLNLKYEYFDGVHNRRGFTAGVSGISYVTTPLLNVTPTDLSH